MAIHKKKRNFAQKIKMVIKPDRIVSADLRMNESMRFHAAIMNLLSGGVAHERFDIRCCLLINNKR